MSGAQNTLGTIHLAIVAALQACPDGLDIEEIRRSIGDFGNQQHLDKRVRDLYPHYIIKRPRVGKRTIYKFVGAREAGTWDYATISKTLRAKILHRDGKRCRMCGKTVEEDHVKLHVDHQIPREWGGQTTEENLWALCSACNEGKKNYFATFDGGVMKEILALSSVHERIAQLLKLKLGEWVESDLLEFVANFDDYQEDWQKRLRELRYTGLKIPSKKRKVEKRTKSFYRVSEWVEMPANLTAFVAEYEKKRAAKNRATKKLGE